MYAVVFYLYFINIVGYLCETESEIHISCSTIHLLLWQEISSFVQDIFVNKKKTFNNTFVFRDTVICCQKF